MQTLIKVILRTAALICGVLILISIIIPKIIDLVEVARIYCYPTKKLAYITINDKGGIGSSGYGQHYENYLDELGEPDEFDVRCNPASWQYRYSFIYDRYCLKLNCIVYETIDEIIIEFTKDNIGRIRFFDDEPLSNPLSVNKIIKLFGKPEKDHVANEDDAYQGDCKSYTYYHDDGSYCIAYKYDKYRYRFVCKDETITKLMIN